MTEYGIQPTGYVRKPLSVFLAELEAAMVTEFGPGVIQTPQSPLGQLNGLMADLLAEVDERLLDLYQSYDPDQAEGTRLDVLGRIRLLRRQDGISDEEFRRVIANEDQARIDVQDISGAIAGLPGVTFARVFTPDMEVPEVQPGTIAVAVMGGDDEDIAATLRTYLAPGINTYGNTRVSTDIDGFCRTLSIVRPVDLPVDLRVYVRRSLDKMNCPAPSTLAIKEVLEAGWLADRFNGLWPSYYRIRSIIERAFNNVEVTGVEVSFDEGLTWGSQNDFNVSFLEIVSISAEVIEI